MRYFFNLVEAGVSDAIDAVIWASQARENDLQPGQAIALGFDGSRSRDCTSLVASRISDGRWFHLRTWNPADHAAKKVPRGEVDKVVSAAFAAYDVRYLFYDPTRWQEYGDRWSGRWGKRVVENPNNVDRRMDDMVTRFLARALSDLTHDGSEILTQHARNAALAAGTRRAPRPDEDQTITHRYLKVIKKRENLHIDAFVAALNAELARGKAIEDGGLQPAMEPLIAWG
jgi:phage terminase large subunit-like protein